MRIKLKLYYPYDHDLIALREATGVNFGQIILRALTAYESGGMVNIDLPKLTCDVTHNRRKTTEVCQISFREDLYPDIVCLLSDIEDDMRTRFIKSVLRACFGKDLLGMYFKENRASPVIAFTPRQGKESTNGNIPAEIREFPQQEPIEETEALEDEDAEDMIAGLTFV